MDIEMAIAECLAPVCKVCGDAVLDYCPPCEGTGVEGGKAAEEAQTQEILALPIV